MTSVSSDGETSVLLHGVNLVTLLHTSLLFGIPFFIFLTLTALLLKRINMRMHLLASWVARRQWSFVRQRLPFERYLAWILAGLGLVLCAPLAVLVVWGTVIYWHVSDTVGSGLLLIAPAMLLTAFGLLYWRHSSWRLTLVPRLCFAAAVVLVLAFELHILTLIEYTYRNVSAVLLTLNAFPLVFLLYDLGEATVRPFYKYKGVLVPPKSRMVVASKHLPGEDVQQPDTSQPPASAPPAATTRKRPKLTVSVEPETIDIHVGGDDTQSERSEAPPVRVQSIRPHEHASNEVPLRLPRIRRRYRILGMYLLSLLVLVVFAVIVEGRSNVNISFGVISALCIVCFDVVLFVSVYGQQIQSPSLACGFLIMTRAVVVLSGDLYWFIGHSILYAIVGLVLGVSIINVYLPRKTALDRRIQISRKMGLGEDAAPDPILTPLASSRNKPGFVKLGRFAQSVAGEWLHKHASTVSMAFLTVMFIADTFVAALVDESPDVVIVNPHEQFEAGVVALLLVLAIMTAVISFRSFENAGFQLSTHVFKLAGGSYLVMAICGVVNFIVTDSITLLLLYTVGPAFVNVFVYYLANWVTNDYRVLLPPMTRNPPGAPLLYAFLTGGLPQQTYLMFSCVVIELAIIVVVGIIYTNIDPDWLGWAISAMAVVIISTIMPAIEWFNTLELSPHLIGQIVFSFSCLVGSVVAFWLTVLDGELDTAGMATLLLTVAYPYVVVVIVTLLQWKDNNWVLTPHVKLSWTVLGVVSAIFFGVAAFTVQPWQFGAGGLLLITLLSLTQLLGRWLEARYIYDAVFVSQLVQASAFALWFVYLVTATIFHDHPFQGFGFAWLVAAICIAFSFYKQWALRTSNDQQLFYSPSLFPVYAFGFGQDGQMQLHKDHRSVWCVFAILAMLFLWGVGGVFLLVNAYFPLAAMGLSALLAVTYAMDRMREPNVAFGEAVEFLVEGSDMYNRNLEHAKQRAKKQHMTFFKQARSGTTLESGDTTVGPGHHRVLSHQKPSLDLFASGGSSEPQLAELAVPEHVRSVSGITHLHEHDHVDYGMEYFATSMMIDDGYDSDDSDDDDAHVIVNGDLLLGDVAHGEHHIIHWKEVSDEMDDLFRAIPLTKFCVRTSDDIRTVQTRPGEPRMSRHKALIKLYILDRQVAALYRVQQKYFVHLKIELILAARHLMLDHDREVRRLLGDTVVKRVGDEPVQLPTTPSLHKLVFMLKDERAFRKLRTKRATNKALERARKAILRRRRRENEEAERQRALEAQQKEQVRMAEMARTRETVNMKLHSQLRDEHVKAVREHRERLLREQELSRQARDVEKQLQHHRARVQALYRRHEEQAARAKAEEEQRLRVEKREIDSLVRSVSRDGSRSHSHEVSGTRLPSGNSDGVSELRVPPGSEEELDSDDDHIHARQDMLVPPRSSDVGSPEEAARRLTLVREQVSALKQHMADQAAQREQKLAQLRKEQETLTAEYERKRAEIAERAAAMKQEQAQRCEQVAKAIAENVCTRIRTGPCLVEQAMYRCLTCEHSAEPRAMLRSRSGTSVAEAEDDDLFDDDTAWMVCKSCVRECHAQHEVEQVATAGPMLCSCGVHCLCTRPLEEREAMRAQRTLAMQEIADDPAYQTYMAELERFERHGHPFVDREFPRQSLRPLFRDPSHVHRKKWLKFRWKRLQCKSGDEPVMARPLEPQDIRQGHIGDCWFMSALAVLAIHEDKYGFLDKCFLSKKEHGAGIYALRFYKNGHPRVVVVDDWIPYYKGKPAFGHSTRGDLWVPLIEKAYAKLHRSYESIESGFVDQALVDLTGGIASRIDMTQDETRDRIRTGQLWKLLLTYHQSGFLMGAGSPAGSDRDTSQWGIVQGHAYSILNVVEADGNQLLLLRNPWGRIQWQGEWREGSRLWTRRIRSLVGPTKFEDGLFWLSFHEFTRHFEDVYVCRLFDFDERWISHEPIISAWSGPSAGGCSNFETVANSPQWTITVLEPNTTLVINLAQADPRGTHEQLFAIAIELYDNGGRRVTRRRAGTLVASNPESYIFRREVTCQCELPASQAGYTLLCTTFNPDEVRDYTLRIYSSKRVHVKEAPPLFRNPHKQGWSSFESLAAYANSGHVEKSINAARTQVRQPAHVSSLGRRLRRIVHSTNFASQPPPPSGHKMTRLASLASVVSSVNRAAVVDATYARFAQHA